MLFTIEINGNKVSTKRDETILAVLNRNGIRVPTLCHIEGFTPTGACRLCVVEVDGRQNLVPACSQPVEESMKIWTHSPRVQKARKTLLEILLANHPDNCLSCDRSGLCELQKLSDELFITEHSFRSQRKTLLTDRNCPSIERDPNKCVLCGRCIRICNEVIGVHAIDVINRGIHSTIGTIYNKGLNEKSCVKCGQCIMICPTGAIRESYAIERVQEALNIKENYCVIQISPSVIASIGEDIGLRATKDVFNILSTALMRIGFKQVFDTSFAAELTITGIVSEFMQRFSESKPLPLFTSCCPSWVRYIEELRPEFKSRLASVKSPQMMMGTLIKKYFGYKRSIPPGSIFSVSVMPCTSKKYEAVRQASSGDRSESVDAVLTTRELVRLIRLSGIDFSSLESEPMENYFNIQSSAGKMVGAAGGTMEGIIRSLYYRMAGQDLHNLKVTDLRGFKGKKEIRMKIGKSIFGFASVSGLANAIRLLEEIEAGRSDLHLVEIMACPNGCVNGGGQRIGADEKIIKARTKILYDMDEESGIRSAHKNPLLEELSSMFR